MSRVWFAGELETVATWWRLARSDGVTLGFTTHDADLWFDGVLHSASPGMVPSAIRRSAGFDADSAEVSGAISSDMIAAADLDAGRYDGALVAVGLIDWVTLEVQPIYSGTIGMVSETDAGFMAELQSRKQDLSVDPVPRTSPTCRAAFCGLGCGLSAVRFEHLATLASQDVAGNAVTLAGGPAPADLVAGQVRWLDGPYAGIAMGVTGTNGAGGLVLDRAIDVAIPVGARVVASEGCDHTLATCSARFANAVNFQGEPFLPGNDMVVRYGVP